MIDPDEIAAAARRLGAKMVADQAVPMMLSFVGLHGECDEEQVRRMHEDDEPAVVVVARGAGKREMIRWLHAVTGGRASSIEIEPRQRQQPEEPK